MGWGMKKEQKQLKLFNVGSKDDWWKEHWKDMPEYKSNNEMPYKSILVHFKNRENMESFSKLVNQKFGYQSKFIWYPEEKIESYNIKQYKDES
jgi:hypothetical protein